MRVLYIGDIVGEVGLKLVEAILPELKSREKIDVVIAQAENVTEGRGISVSDFKRLLKTGVDFCTGGNWSLHQSEIIPLLEDPESPIIRPANYPVGTKGLGYKYIDTKFGKVLIVSLLGQIVGRDANRYMDNPLLIIDQILSVRPTKSVAATIVNLHGDYSSEKVIIGYYLDGKVSLVVGDHWHVPTADASVLPKGTAHMTDVGMCGSLDSSLGIKFDSVIPRWHDNLKTKNELETKGRLQFNALLVDIDESTGLALNTKPIRVIKTQS